jgi:hypothetical protein
MLTDMDLIEGRKEIGNGSSKGFFPERRQVTLGLLFFLIQSV